MVTQKSITPPALKGPTLPLPLWGYPKGVRAFSVLRTLKGSFFRGDPIFCDHISPSPQGGEDNPFISPPPNKKGANAHRAGAHSALGAYLSSPLWGEGGVVWGPYQVLSPNQGPLAL